MAGRVGPETSSWCRPARARPTAGPAPDTSRPRRAGRTARRSLTAGSGPGPGRGRRSGPPGTTAGLDCSRCTNGSHARRCGRRVCRPGMVAGRQAGLSRPLVGRGRSGPELVELPLDVELVSADERRAESVRFAPPHSRLGDRDNQYEVCIAAGQGGAPLSDQQRLKWRWPCLLGPLMQFDSPTPLAPLAPSPLGGVAL